MRLINLLIAMFLFGFLLTENISFAAPCPIYYYDARCIKKGYRTDLIFSGVQSLFIDTREGLKKKFTAIEWHQSCLGKPEPNHGEDAPPPELTGSVFIAQEATEIMEAGVLTDMRFKYILKRSNSKGEFDVLLTSDEFQSNPDTALERLLSKMESSTSCIAGHVYLNNESVPQKSFSVAQKPVETPSDGPNLVDENQKCYDQAAAKIKNIKDPKDPKEAQANMFFFYKQCLASSANTIKTSFKRKTHSYGNGSLAN